MKAICGKYAAKLRFWGVGRFRLIPALLFCMVFSAAARADAPASGDDPGDDPFPFPLIPLLETVNRGAVFWRPDWPPNLPPDAFSLPANTRAGTAGKGLCSISLSLEPELRAAWDTEERLFEFPHFWRGAFYRIKVRYDAGGTFRGLFLAGAVPADGTADGSVLEFELEQPGGIAGPFLLRSGDRVFWIVMAGGAEGMDGGAGGMDGGGDMVSETWYDGEGNFFGLVTCRFAGNGGAKGMDGGAGDHIASLEIRDRWAESYRYYSGGTVTRVESPAGVYTAVYGEKGPLYREYTSAPAFASGAGLEDPPVSAAASFPPETDFQWDERGFLVLLRNRDAGGVFAGEFRYEYGTDNRGNWTVRRETEMVRRPGLLVPVFRGELRRRITYAEAEE